MSKNVSRRRLAWLCLVALIACLGTAAGQDLRLGNAIVEQDPDAVEALLATGVDVNMPRADGATALLWAAHWDDLLC